MTAKNKDLAPGAQRKLKAIAFELLSGWLPVLAKAAPAGGTGKAKSCILLWMDGGPSHKDTFDLRPGTENGGPYQQINTNVTGVGLTHAINVCKPKAVLFGDDQRPVLLERPGVQELCDVLARHRLLHEREGIGLEPADEGRRLRRAQALVEVDPQRHPVAHRLAHGRDADDAVVRRPADLDLGRPGPTPRSWPGLTTPLVATG